MADPTINRPHLRLTDLHGAGRLAIKAVEGMVDIVDTLSSDVLHGLGQGAQAELVKGSAFSPLRKFTAQMRRWLDASLGESVEARRNLPSSRQREAVLAALNGVIGDYLADSGHPWAIDMCLRSDGRALTLERSALMRDFPRANGRILILVHGLCRNDLQWRRRGHDHGMALARDLGYTPLYLHYNTGRHISQNGRQFAELLDTLFRQWPVPVEEMVILAHSMGGLVARSACRYADLAGYAWRHQLKKMVFLGTPHHGSPIERGGNWLVAVLDKRMLTAPLGRLGRIRSAGITDLRHGNLLDEDWSGRDQEHSEDCRQPVPLPGDVSCYAIAGAAGRRASDIPNQFLGDGLMMPETALGRHRDPQRTLAFPMSRQWIAYGTHHLDLLNREEVYEKILEWLRERA